MGMERIEGADAPSNGQGRKQLASFWDLIGFFAHRQLSPDLLTVMGEAGKQMRGISLRRPGSSHRFPIDGEGISGRGETASPDPRREDPSGGSSC